MPARAIQQFWKRRYQGLSPYGTTAIVVKSGDDAEMIFGNTGKVTITSPIDDLTKVTETNVIGLMVEKGKTLFKERVSEVMFAISGQGCDSDGSTYSDGTAAIFVQDKNAEVAVQAKELNIEVSPPLNRL